jgi:hypothetical protein
MKSGLICSATFAARLGKEHVFNVIISAVIGVITSDVLSEEA